MTTRNNIIHVEIDKGIHRTSGITIAMGDKYAERFGARITQDGELIDLERATVQGLFIRADYKTILLEGVVEKDLVYVDLYPECYDVMGGFMLSIKIIIDGTITTIRMIDGNVKVTTTGNQNTSPPVGSPTLAELITRIEGLDQEAIVQQVIAALGTPVFGMVDAENNIILTGKLADGTYKIVYEDAQGNRTEIGTLGHDADAPNYTNQIPISTDTDGSIYNGKGYAEATRISSSSGNPASVSASVATPAFATGFIPIKAGDVVRLKNCWIDTKEIPADTSPYGNQTWGLAITFYKSDKSYDSQFVAWTNMGVTTNQVTATIDSNGYVTEFVYNGARSYMRMTLASNDPAQAIVTINEPIV